MRRTAREAIHRTAALGSSTLRIAAGHPPGSSVSGDAKAWRNLLPGTVACTDRPGATPFPILRDADQAVSTRLGLFTIEWNHAKADQAG